MIDLNFPDAPGFQQHQKFVFCNIDKLTMKDLQFIIKRLKANEEIAKKFYMVETKILSIRNFRDLFDVLLSEIREKFNVSFVWISIIRKSELSKLIQSAGSSNMLEGRLNMIDKTAFTRLYLNIKMVSNQISCKIQG